MAKREKILLGIEETDAVATVEAEVKKLTTSRRTNAPALNCRKVAGNAYHRF